ncbi:MAG: hypothetical protein J3Q66DRAFT_385278, partial [Benniella sp.]
MPRTFAFPMTLTLLTAVFALFFSVSFSPIVHAQRFRPIPRVDPCSAYVEGQGLYVFGGTTKNGAVLSQAFVLDLSVSWNTSDPIFKELPNGPEAEDASCATFNNGEDLFVLSKATGYIYNVKSNSWTVMHDNNFVDTPYTSVATDPESGMVYITNGAMNFTGDEVVLALDMKTKTSSTIPFSPMRSKVFEQGFAVYFTSMAWCAYLRSFLLNVKDNIKLYTFTPSKASEPSRGWSVLDIPTPISHLACILPYGGSKMLYFDGGMLFIMDMATQTNSIESSRSRSIPGLSKASCAVSGDQFIVWGGETGVVYMTSAKRLDDDDGGTYRIHNKTYVYNLKTRKWTSRYVAPLGRPITTSTHASEASQTPSPHAPLTTTTPGHSDASLSDKTLVNIIIIVTGVMMAIILTIIFVYLKRTKRKDLCAPKNAKSNASSHSNNNLNAQRNWRMDGILGRLHLGSTGARPLSELSEHPHAIVEDPTMNRNVQEGAVEVLIALQHPHTVMGKEFSVEYNAKMELESTKGYGGKEELE